jgi:hypothetical protein
LEVVVVPLFDERVETIGDRAKLYAESTFEYYNRSARTDIARIKQVLEEWYAHFPEDAKVDLRKRFRSPSERQHQAAFFELYLHELALKLGYTISAHPEVEEPTHPDFLLSKNGNPKFYLEATIAAESDDKASEQKRMDQVYDTLNNMVSPDFLVSLRVRGAPQTSPPGRRLRERIQRWFATLDWPTVRDSWERDGFEGLPMLSWEYEGWSLLIQPIPKTQEKRGSADVRPIGLTMPLEVNFLAVDEDIKCAVEAKNKYGTLDLPFVVAINVIGDFCSQYDVANALFGHETVIFSPTGTRPGERLHDGAWDGPKGPRNTTISAVLVYRQLRSWNAKQTVSWFFHNPWARIPLPTDALPFTQFVPDQQSGKLKKLDGRNPGSYLDLQDPWPPEDADWN